MISLYSRELPGEDRAVEPSLVCDTPAKAVSALDELGLCMNWVTLVREQHMTILMYQGWMYTESPERFVDLPFNSDVSDFGTRFEDFLTAIFAPHLSNTDVHRSLINVSPKPDDPAVFLVHLMLLFKASEADAIAEALTSVEDGHEDVQGRVFWLD